MSADETYSHPGQSIRHTYPLAHAKVDLTAAIEIWKPSLPLVIVRLLGLVGFSLFLLVCTGAFAAVLSLAAAASGVDALKWGGLYIGAIISIGVYPLMRDLIFAKPRLAHSLLLIEALVHRDLSGVTSPLNNPKAIIEELLGPETYVDSLVRGVRDILNEFHKNVGTLRGAFPNIPSEAVLQFIVGRLTVLPEVVLSYGVARKDSNLLRASQDGIVYYAKHSVKILQTAVGCYIVEGACTLGALLIALGPAVFLGFLVPEFLRPWMTFFAVLLTLNVKDAVIHPIFLAFVMQRFHYEIKKQRFCEQTEKGLFTLSPSFKELAEEAAQDA